MESYDRYGYLRKMGDKIIVPYAKIEEKKSDFFETYRKNNTKLSIISYNYYGDPNYAWLIMTANPEYGSLEFDIPDGANIRIPYPLEESLQQYINSIKEYEKNYGL